MPDKILILSGNERIFRYVYGFVGSVNTDDDAEAMTYEFDKTFPEITKHAEAYEAEIAKLIENLEQDIETVLVEYRDI
jgi:hypothetical protein